MNITGVRIRDGKKQFDVKLADGSEVIVIATSEEFAIAAAKAGDFLIASKAKAKVKKETKVVKKGKKKK